MSMNNRLIVAAKAINDSIAYFMSAWTPYPRRLKQEQDHRRSHRPSPDASLLLELERIQELNERMEMCWRCVRTSPNPMPPYSSR